MKKYLIISCLLISSAYIHAQRFTDYFEDRTLRLDYIFAGNNTQQNIYLDELVSMPRWYGKRQHLAEVPLAGNGQVIVRSAASSDTIYRNSFSTLFQEWIATDEAKRTQKSFENVFLVPFPKQPVDITVELYDYHMRRSKGYPYPPHRRHRNYALLHTATGSRHITLHPYCLCSRGLSQR